jgi:hypothetical protein
MENKSKPAKIGDIWHRVEGYHIGDEVYEGMKLEWSMWVCTKTTTKGAWFNCLKFGYKKTFALTIGSRKISRTKKESINRLIHRKRRHISILEWELEAAKDTLELAKKELDFENGH